MTQKPLPSTFYPFWNLAEDSEDEDEDYAIQYDNSSDSYDGTSIPKNSKTSLRLARTNSS